MSKGYESVKTFFETIKTNYLIVKPEQFYSTIIDLAYENKDYTTVIEAYLFCMNYDSLTKDHIIKVYES